MLWETSALFIYNCNSVMKHIYMHAWYQTIKQPIKFFELVKEFQAFE